MFVRRISDLSERLPSLYLSLMRMKHGGTESVEWLVHDNTDLVIEGMQRSANSFAIRAFRSASEANARMNIATHIHSPVQILEGCHRGIPVMLLIRNPDDLVPSLMAWAEQLKKPALRRVDDEKLLKLVQYWTGRFGDFYSRLMPIREQFLTVRFEEVVKDFGQCVKELNKKFGTHYDVFSHTRENVEVIRSNSAIHVLPSEERSRMKLKYDGLYAHPDNMKNREKAQQVYHSFLS